jgi:hypothetical protein
MCCFSDGALAVIHVRVSQSLVCSPDSFTSLVSGMKVAKFEIKMILALFLSCYKYELVDPSGKPLKRSPQPDRNDIQKVCQLL